MYLTCIGVYRCQDTLKYVLRVNSGTFESKCRCSPAAPNDVLPSTTFVANDSVPAAASLADAMAANRRATLDAMPDLSDMLQM